jgi:hypothetical protein
MGNERFVRSKKNQRVHCDPDRFTSSIRLRFQWRHIRLFGRQFARNYLLLAAIVLVCVIPFSSRAIYLDEHIFLQIARSAQTNWMFPQDTPEIFRIVVPNFAAHTHPPVGEYSGIAVHGIGLVPRSVLFGWRSIFPARPCSAFTAWRGALSRIRFGDIDAGIQSSVLCLQPDFDDGHSDACLLLVGFALYFGLRPGTSCTFHCASVCLSSPGTGLYSSYTAGMFFPWHDRSARPSRISCRRSRAAALALWLAAMSVHFGEFHWHELSIILRSKDHSFEIYWRR